MTNKNKDIEFLRAVAILYTLIVHLNTLLLFPLTPFKWIETHFELSIGVDLFFAISGFVITQSLLDLSKNAVVPRHRLVLAFWTRRFFRLFPAAVMWLAVTALYLASTDTLQGNIAAFMATLLNVMNIYGAYCVSHTAAYYCDYYIHGHYWSLSLEEQFYLIYPLFFFLLPRRWLLPLVIAGISLQWFWWRPIWTFGWFIRTDAILWGVLLALLPSKITSPAVLRSTDYRVLLQVAGITLLIALPAVAREVVGFGEAMKVYGVALTALLSALLVWVAALDRDLLCVGNRFRRIALYLGSRSYSLYVSHLIVYNIVHHYLSKFAETHEVPLADNLILNVTVLAVGVLLTLGASELTYRFIEQRLRDKGRAYARHLLNGSERPSASPMEFAK